MIVPMTADAHGMLGSALAGLFHPAPAELRTSSQKRWASVTFAGARHRYALSVSGEGACAAVDQAAGTLKAQDFSLDGHVVADIAVVRRKSCGTALVEIEFEALTVEAS